MSYAFRQSNSPTESVLIADLFGRPQHARIYTRGSKSAFGFDDVDQDDGATSEEPCPELTRAWLKKQIDRTLSRYEVCGAFSAIELRTIRALWLDGLSLRQFAKSEGVTAEAVRARIEGNRKGQGGIRLKAPEFYRWWSFKQRRRRKAHVYVAGAFRRSSVQSCFETAKAY